MNALPLDQLLLKSIKFPEKDGKLRKKLFNDAIGAVKQAKKTLAAPGLMKKQSKYPVDQLKVT